MNQLICLLIGTPRRALCSLGGFIALALFVRWRPGYVQDLLMGLVREFLPFFQIIVMGMIVIGVVMAILGPKKGGGNKGG